MSDLRPPAHAALELFAQRFGADHPGAPRLFFAPGRLNLIGAHLDYSGGDVLQMAVHRGVYAAIRPRSDDRIRMASGDMDAVIETRVGDVGDRSQPGHHWAGYCLGVQREFVRRGVDAIGFDLAIGSDLAIASGLSSSAALEVCTAFALDAVLGTALDRREIAELAHRAETDYVGVQCGIMDQFASALGREGHLLLLHCHAIEFEHVPAPAHAFEALVMDTKKARRLANSGFNDRVRECAEVHAILRREVRDLPYLAAYEPADLVAAEPHLSPLHQRRFRHVVSEMGRVRYGVEGLRAGDIARLGESMDGAHESARVDYEVTCAELDVITAAAREHEAAFGARFTGAGFGGCACALVRSGESSTIIAHVTRRFEAEFGYAPGFEVLRPGPGPRELSLPSQ